MNFKIQKKISLFLFNGLFFIPLLTILGPFFPDLLISFTVIFSIIFIITPSNKIFKNHDKVDLFILIFFIFFVYILINSFINFFDNNDLSFVSFEKYFSRSLFLFRFIFYPVSIIYIAKKFNLKVEKKYLYLFLFTILFVIFDTLFQYFNGKDIFGFIPMERDVVAIGRLSGPFGDELIPGSYLMRYFFITVFFLSILVNNKKYFNYFFSLFLILCVTTIFMTGERSVSILVCFGILIYFFIYKNQRIIISFALVTIFLISTVILSKNPELKQRVVNHSLYQFGISLEKGSNKFNYNELFKKTGRTFIDSHYGAHWETAYEIWKRNKLIGIGLKQFRYECSNKVYDDNLSKLKVIRCATHPHNTYFEILSELGIIGLIIFILLFLSLIRKILKINSYEKNIKFLLISIILLFWPLITSGSFFTNMTQIYLSFLLTIIFMIENQMFKQVK